MQLYSGIERTWRQVVLQVNNTIKSLGSFYLSNMPFSMFLRYWPSWLQNGCSISQDHIPCDNISKTREKGFLLSVSLWRKHFLEQTAYFPFYLLAELRYMAIFKPVPLEGNEMTKTGLSQQSAQVKQKFSYQGRSDCL